MDDEIVRLEENMAQLNTVDQSIQPENTSLPSTMPTTSAAATAAEDLPFNEMTPSNNKSNQSTDAANVTKVIVIRKRGINLLMERLNRVLLFLFIPLFLLLCNNKLH